MADSPEEAEENFRREWATVSMVPPDPITVEVVTETPGYVRIVLDGDY